MSKVFEFHFNPVSEKKLFSQGPHKLNLEQGRVHRIPFFKKTKKQNTIFDTFCFFPETRNENKLGRLYLMGEMKNVFARSQNLLPEIAEVIKQEYFQSNYETPHDCFRASLEKADQYLAEVKKENIHPHTKWGQDAKGVQNDEVSPHYGVGASFLGNLGFTAIALLPDFSVSISKVGTSKIFLLTGKNIFDVGDNFNSAESPIHTFPNVVEGSLESTDKIIIVTDQLFDAFYEQEIFHNLINIKKSKQVKELFKQKKPGLTQAFGCCLLVFVKKELPKIFLQRSKQNSDRPASKSPILRKTLEKISYKPTFLQRNLGRMLFFCLILAILLVLGWILF